MIPYLDKRFGLLVSMLMMLSTPLQAHELQPSAFEMRQLTAQRYELAWRAPLYFKNPHPARLALPDDWQIVSGPGVERFADAILHRYVVNVPEKKLEGAVIRFIGLEATITDVFARFVWLDGSEITAIARPSQPWIEVVVQPSAWRIISDYTILGVEHILFGFDHLTFVFALLLIVSGTRRLLITVTAFTLAHSITLATATLGIVWIPGPPIEAVIALSILFLASELVKVNRGQISHTAQYPWIVAFTFGLLHGFGFAGALNDIGLPQNEVALALLMFNLGVEIGQLLFIAAALVVLVILHPLKSLVPGWCRQVSAYALGGIAAFWLIERLVQF